jgi:ribonucleotide reductase beta subunit family protein with ferritin-like domain
MATTLQELKQELKTSGTENSSLIHKKEKILEESMGRYVIFPVKYHSLWKHYKKMQSCFWTTEEIDFTKDNDDWKKLNENEKHFIKNVLAFFAGSDGIVMENLVQRFMCEVQIPEARHCYSYQIMIEAVHSETYSLMIDNYVKDHAEKEKLFEAIEKIPCVAKKANWAIKWINDESSSFAIRMVAFAVIEGIFFSGSFCAIYWLKQRGLMPGLTFSNELISRDEGQHTDLAVLLLEELSNKPSEKDVHDLVKEAVAIEKEFICESLPCALIGMNSKMMSEYIEYVADRLLVQMNYSRIWNTKNPFEWMELISLEPKMNFFEGKVGQYTKAGVGKSIDENQISFDSEDF